MASLKKFSTQALSDIREGRHREAYALFAIGLAVAALGLVDVVSGRIIQSVVLLALSFLVFHTSVEVSEHAPGLDSVLKSREDFGSFSKLVVGVKTLDAYGPTAVNILVNSADIRRLILDLGGTVRVIVQDENSETLKHTAYQLDDNLDLARTLHTSLAILDRLQREPGFSYRKLGANPGFSLIVVNREKASGYVIFESHGFKDENIADRMHIVITKADSPRWFSYWVARFDALWDAAAAPASVS
jgi:hypothetical protein